MGLQTLSQSFIDEAELDAQMAHASTTDLAAFWSDIRSTGTPLREADATRVTFLWRAEPSEDIGSIYLFVNRVTDKDNIPLGMMHNIAGTDIWVRTIELTETTRTTYCFRELAPGQVQEVGPPRLERGGMQFDPLNLLPPTAEIDGRYGMSVFVGALSPAQPEWESSAALRHILRGSIHQTAAEYPGTDGTVEKPCILYLPPREAIDGPIPLLTMFDAEKWFDRLNAPRALDYAIAEGTLPPLAIVSVANLSIEDRMHSLGAGFEFLGHVAEHLVPWAEHTAAEEGIEFVPRGTHGRVIAGESLGGLSALCAILEHPDVWNSAIAQSPSLWRTPNRTGSPLDMQTRGGGEWLIEQFSSAPNSDSTPRVRLSVGTREGPSLSRVQQLALTMKATGWDSRVHVYDGGHDDACWRGELFAHLAELLRN